MKNREIKFRIFYNNSINGCERLNKNGWEWMSLELNSINKENWVSGVYPKNERYIRKQFTGLKDKNGKDIYEGDIVKCGNQIGEIKYDLNYACFLVKNKQKNGVLRSYFMEINSEIIGNIYENPELLK